MKTPVFVSFCLLLSLGLALAYGEFRAYFSDPHSVEQETARLRDEIIRREAQISALQDAFQDFRFEVAQALPKKFDLRKSPEKEYPMRRLASVVRSSDPVKLNEGLAATLLERGREHFRAGRYSKAREVLETFMEKFSYSSFVTEAQFLLIESLYQLHDLETCVTQIQQMMEQFPEAELTGFAMIRLAGVFEEQNRWDEAIDIYRTVLKSFPSRSVAMAAAKSLRSLEP